jgi:hypothetical protein
MPIQIAVIGGGGSSLAFHPGEEMAHRR